MTSKWLRMVTAQRNYTVDWKFISLRLINAEVDYDTHFPPGYEDGHTAGLRLLRVAACTRAEHGAEAVGPPVSGDGNPHLRHPQRPRGHRSAIGAAPGSRGRRSWPRSACPPNWPTQLEDYTSLDVLLRS